MLVWIQRSEQRVAQVRAELTSALDKKGTETNKAFMSFVDSVFPYRKRMEEKAKEEQADMLKRWTAAGPIRVVPTVDLDPEKGIRQKQRERGSQMQQAAKPRTVERSFQEEQWIQKRRQRRTASSTRTGSVTRPALLKSKSTTLRPARS